MQRALGGGRLAGILGVAALAVSATVAGAELRADPGNYLRVLGKLRAGDTMLLAPGTYTGGLPLADMSGRTGQPIVIRGPDDQSAVFKADDCCNTVQLDTASHIVIRDLTLDGSGTNGAFGVASRGPCHDITVENLRILNYGANQQIVGISTKGPAWNWIVRNNTIIAAGTGMYFGDSDGTDPFVNGLIEHNLVVDTLGYNLQIKHQLPRPTGIGMPEGQSRTVIRHNVFSKRRNASRGDGARPNVLVGHFPLTGIGADDRYEIYGNFFYQNPTEALFQGEGNVVLHDNLFVNSGGSAVNIQAHNDKPRAVTVFHNTIVAAGGGIRILGADPAYRQQIIANAVFAGEPLAGPNQQANIADSYSSASNYLRAPTDAIGKLDLGPRPGQLQGPATDLSVFAPYLDSARDFNGASRAGRVRGAYEGETPAGAWTPALSIKPSVPTGEPWPQYVPDL